MPPFDVNYLAVLVAAVATFVLGALWYSPLLFAKPWIRLHGYTEEKVKSMQKEAGKAYTVSFLAYLVMAYVLAILVAWTGVQTAADGACLGSLCWLGFAATIGLTALMFSDKKLGTYLIDAGYQLAYLVLMGVILAVWR